MTKAKSLQASIKEHVEVLKSDLARLRADLEDAHDLKLHQRPGLVGRITEVEKEIEYLSSLLYD
jgi:hypothetical protein